MNATTHSGDTESSGNDEKADDSSRKESLVWQYATRNTNTKEQSATCGICGTIIKTTNWSTTGLRKHLTQVHGMATMLPTEAPKKSNISPELRKELHDLAVKAIIEDSRSFNDFRRSGMLKFLRRASPGEYFSSNRTPQDLFAYTLKLKASTYRDQERNGRYFIQSFLCINSGIFCFVHNDGLID